MEGRPKRHLLVTVRGAADVPTSRKPYVILSLGDQELKTSAAPMGGVNPVWDEPIELLLPPPLPDERPLLLRVRLMSRVPICPDPMLGSGTQPLSDLFYGGGMHEVTVPLTTEAAKPAGHIHLGLYIAKKSRPGEDVGSAVGTVLGQVPGGGPASAAAAPVAGPIQLPSAEKAEMQVPALGVLGAGNMQDPSKPGYGLYNQM